MPMPRSHCQPDRSQPACGSAVPGHGDRRRAQGPGTRPTGGRQGFAVPAKRGLRRLMTFGAVAAADRAMPDRLRANGPRRDDCRDPVSKGTHGALTLWLGAVDGDLQTGYTGADPAFQFAPYGSCHRAACAGHWPLALFISICKDHSPVCLPLRPANRVLLVGFVGLKHLADQDLL